MRTIQVYCTMQNYVFRTLGKEVEVDNQMKVKLFESKEENKSLYSRTYNTMFNEFIVTLFPSLLF